MIVLLTCSINLSASNNDTDDLHPSTGELVNRNDSVLISYNDLRIANSKIIQLNYEQQINDKLRKVVANDSIALANYKILNDEVHKSYKKAIRQRNIAIGGAAVFFITTIIALFVK